MVLKYSDKPQLHYGNQYSADNWRSRFPANARPISTAPPQAVIVHEPDSSAHRAYFRSGAWRRLTWEKNWRDGSGRWTEDGVTISNPVMWSPWK